MAKITIVLHDLRGGGAEKMMVRLANQLAKEGDDVELLLLTGGGSNMAFVNDNVRLIELQSKRTMQALMPLRKHLKIRQPDAILSVLTHVNVVAALACFSLGWSRKLTVSERNTFSLDKSVNNNKVMRATYAIAPWIYRVLPNPVIAVSKGVAADLVGCSLLREKDVVTAPNPVITDETELAASKKAQHPWLVNKSSPVIISVGRLSHQKGFDMLLEALHRVNQRIPCKLVVFGEGELRKELAEQAIALGIDNLVSFAGYTDNPIAEVKQADLFVLSSRFEGSPNGLVEAMSVGTPAVAFDCPHGPKEILIDSLRTNLVEYTNVDALVETMARVLVANNDKTLYQQAVETFRANRSAHAYRKLMFAQA